MMADKKKILSIEDNAANQKIVSDLLTLRGGYEVIKASNGVEGLKKVETEKPDLVIVDIQLPVLDGLKVTEAIRANPNPSVNKLPIIITSSYAMPSDIERGSQAGCNAYFTKPLDLKGLLEKVNEFLQNKL